MVVRSNIIAIRFDENLFSSTILGFNLNWDYKHDNEFTSLIIVNLNTAKKLYIKCGDIDGLIVLGKRQTLLFSLVSDKPSGYKVFRESQAINYQKQTNLFGTL